MPDFLSATNLERFALYAAALSALIFVHEWGHFWTARRFGVGVREFALGFGPALFSRRSAKTGTCYRLNIFPLGGYCAMIGEDATAHDDDRQIKGVPFPSISPWRRLLIVLAGPAVNIVAAVAVLWATGLLLGTPTGTLSRAVGTLVPGDPADRAGIRTGDVVNAVNGKTMTDGDAVVEVIHHSVNRPLELTLDRNGTLLHVRVTPILTHVGKDSFGIIGYSPIPLLAHYGALTSLSNAARQTAVMTQATFSGLGEIFHGAPGAIDGVTGPIGMARAAVAVQSFGMMLFLPFVALLSLSLGIFNLLPIPALDGGRALFVVFELILRKPVDPEKEAMVHLTGFAALIVLALVISYRDVLHIVTNQAPF